MIAAAIPRAASESFYGVYLREAKIGHVAIQQEELMWNGRAAVRYLVSTNMDLSVMGTSTQVKSETTSWTDAKTGMPLAVETRSESGGRITLVKAKYTDRSVTYEVDVTGSKQKDTLTLKPGETWLVDPTSGANVKPEVGLKFKGKVFLAEPGMLKIIDSEVEIVSKDTIEVNGQAISAYKVLDKNPLSPTTSWMNEEGDLLRSDALLGIQIRREPKEKALAAAGTKADLLALVGLRPTGEPLAKPRTYRTVKYEIAGITKGLPAANNIQTAEFAANSATDGAKTAVVTVTTRPLPDGPTVPLYKPKDKVPEKLRPFLQSTLYVQSNEKRFKDLAKEIVGKETDSAKAAQKIAAYVHQRMRPDPTISGFRSATDIWKEPKGVCRDYTLLYTTIARAAGLPTKQCVGIAYANGIFVGHAWPEVWVGNDTWIALEPTWGVPFADATHIKLAEGEITDFLTIASDLTKYQIKVLSVE
jgi:transglutaminase-like putative cysteine protease